MDHSGLKEIEVFSCGMEERSIAFSMVFDCAVTQVDAVDHPIRIFLKLGGIGRLASGIPRISPYKKEGFAVRRKYQGPNIYSLVASVGGQRPGSIGWRLGIKYISFPLVIGNPGDGFSIRSSGKVCAKGSREVVPHALADPLCGDEE